MNTEQMKISTQEAEKLSNLLQSQGLSESEINEILNGNYATFQNETDLTSVFSLDGNHQKVLQGLADGYTIEELPQIGVSRSEIQSFMDTINSYNISVENAKAINQYSNGSNMILSVKRETVTRDDLQSGIMQDLSEKLKERGINQSQISEISDIIQQLDYKQPVHSNYDEINLQMQKMDVPKGCMPSICKAVKDTNSLEHIDETIASLDDGLSKARLPQSMKLYRAIKTNGKVDAQSYVGKSMNNKGYTSTSPLYDSSFAKYDEYDTVMEIYAPKGTQGTYITQLSDYDSVEQEVLLNPNDIYVVGAQSGVIDKNGRSKTVLQGVLLSKERECYKDIEQVQTKTYEPTISQAQTQTKSSMNLPARQNRFSKFFNQVRSRFAKGKNQDSELARSSQTQQSKISDSKPKEKKSWELEPEEKARIQKQTAEIAKRHREQEEKQKQSPAQELQSQGLQHDQSMQHGQYQQGDTQIEGQVSTTPPPAQPMMDVGGMEL